MKRLLITSLCVMFTASFALADWYDGDDYKMHYPQLPDPFGWDVYASRDKVLADDWECTETGAVSDIHLWGSWRWDFASPILNIHASIHKNIPAVPDHGSTYSMPGELLWERDFGPEEFSVRDYGIGDQGWYNPNTGEYIWPDHMMFHQINIVDIIDPFYQEKDTIYWLDISVMPMDTSAEWGWKTSLDHFMDDAVWSDFGVEWQPLYDPETGETLDLAFVITPEPATICLLGLGALALLRKRRV